MPSVQEQFDASLTSPGRGPWSGVTRIPQQDWIPAFAGMALEISMLEYGRSVVADGSPL